jgi:CRISPR-associated endonuclease/helicase Cas3
VIVTAGVAVAELPSFEAYFRAVHGYDPFPWQSRLASDVLSRAASELNGAERDPWPALLDVPTGAGKTSALDVAVYTLACAPGRLPRRVLLVVDRRIVVDQAGDHAERIATSLAQATDGPLRAIADALRALWGAPSEEPPVAVARLRGGMPRDNDWARRPDQPVLGVSTVDQVGSRMLFRGYGVSPRSASIHAGLVGNDTLVLLDEVHLAEPFAQTLEGIDAQRRRSPSSLPERRATVRMSATPGRASRDVHSLSAADHAHPVLARRLAAAKRARLALVRVTGDDEAKKLEVVAKAAVENALRLQADGAKVVDRKSTRLNSSHRLTSRMPSSA